MIQQLHGTGLAGSVGYCVDNLDDGAADTKAISCLQLQSVNKESRFTNDADYIQDSIFDVHLDIQLICGQVCDSAMQRVANNAVFRKLRCSIALQSTSNQKFIESFKPADTRCIMNWNQTRMYGAWYWTLPTELNVIAPTFPKSHPAVGQDGRYDIAGIDRQTIQAGGTTRTELAVLNFKSTGARRYLLGGVEID